MLITNSLEDTEKAVRHVKTVGFAGKVGNTGISVVGNKPSGI
jgi:hypothetical protein